MGFNQRVSDAPVRLDFDVGHSRDTYISVFSFLQKTGWQAIKATIFPGFDEPRATGNMEINQTSTSPCPLSVADFRGTSTVATKPECFGWNAGPSLLELISFIGAVRTSQVAYLSPVSASGPKDKGSGK
jgi:hypothetical protein